MARLENMVTGCAAALTAVLTTVAHELERGLSVGVQVAVDAVVIAVAFTLLKEMLAATLLEMEGLRRLILRGRWIEGTWVDIVAYSDRDPLIGIVHLVPDGPRVRYYGENLDTEGHHAGQFATEGVKLDLPNLSFHYLAGSGGEQGPYLGGSGSIGFDHRGPRGPGRYTGYCLDAAEKARHVLLGRRVEDPGDLAELQDPVTRAAAALRLAAPLLEQVGRKTG